MGLIEIVAAGGRVVCPFKDVCSDYPFKCKHCANNLARSYFRPTIDTRWRSEWRKERFVLRR